MHLWCVIFTNFLPLYILWKPWIVPVSGAQYTELVEIFILHCQNKINIQIKQNDTVMIFPVICNDVKHYSLLSLWQVSFPVMATWIVCPYFASYALISMQLSIFPQRSHACVSFPWMWDLWLLQSWENGGSDSMWPKLSHIKGTTSLYMDLALSQMFTLGTTCSTGRKDKQREVNMKRSWAPRLH